MGDLARILYAVLSKTAEAEGRPESDYISDLKKRLDDD